MKRQSTITALGLGALLTGALLGGCVVRERTTVYEGRAEPVYVDEQPGVIVVQQEPPPPQVEIVAARPGPDFYWVKGYWAARGGRWVWVPGGWARPPRAGAVWIEPRYEHRGGGVQFSAGYWSDGGAPGPRRVVVAPQPAAVAPPPPVVVAQPANVIVVHRVPPPIRAEVIAPRPSPNHIWIKGYWVARNDDWTWIKGHWELPPHAGAVWVEPRYENRGAEVHFSAGFWR